MLWCGLKVSLILDYFDTKIFVQNSIPNAHFVITPILYNNLYNSVSQYKHAPNFPNGACMKRDALYNITYNMQ